MTSDVRRMNRRGEGDAPPEPAAIDFSLDYLFRQWESVPELAVEWREWDGYERFVFELEWAVPESHLYDLRRWSARDFLSSQQRARFDELQSLIGRNRPVLKALFAEDYNFNDP